MTSANNLALMLSDVLRSMQEDFGLSQQHCDNLDQNPSPSDIQKMQEQLKKQLEQMKKGQTVQRNRNQNWKRLG